MPLLHLKFTADETEVTLSHQIITSSLQYKGFTYTADAATDTTFTIDVDIPWLSAPVYNNEAGSANNHRMSIVKGHTTKWTNCEKTFELVPNTSYVPQQFTVKLYQGGTSTPFGGADNYELHLFFEYEEQQMLF